MIKLKQNFREELFNTVPKDVVDFWGIELAEKGGVIRLNDEEEIQAVYLIINTRGMNGACNEWLKFTPSDSGYKLDSVYSALNIYNAPYANEYRYSVDDTKKLIATYLYLGHWEIGKPLATQLKNGETTCYMWGGEAVIPDAIKQHPEVDLSQDEKSVFWVDSDGDKHWSLLEVDTSTFLLTSHTL